MPDRRQILLQDLDIAAGAGIEIGALAWPIVAKTDGAITYVDWADTATLRRKYAGDPNVDIDRIVQVDAVWGDKTLAEAVGPSFRFDYVVASHVVEHVPDLIAWIGELLAVLTGDGEIRLAIPDKRFTFDYLRRETTLAEVLAAHLHRARKPMAGPVLDHFINYIDIDLAGLWDRTVDPDTLRPAPDRLPGAVEMARRVLANEYIDVHCWVFSPVVFTRLMEQLVAAGWLDCRCTMFVDTAYYQVEFFVGIAPATDREAAAASWRHAAEAAEAGSARTHSDREGMIAHIEREKVERALALAAARLAAEERESESSAARLAAAEHQNATMSARLRAAEDHVAALGARLAQAEHEIAALKQSHSWRITAPLRSVSALFFRR